MVPDNTGLNTPLPLFVYGTLCRGMANHARYLEGRFERIIEAEIDGQLYLVEAEGYPYLLPGAGIVKGELVFLSPDRFPATIAGIDRLEDFDPDDLDASLYSRQPCLVRAGKGEPIRAWTYYWNGEDRPGRLIDTGDFRKVLRWVSGWSG